MDEILRDYETIREEMFANIQEDTKNFSFENFYNSDRLRRAVIFFTEKQVGCAITPSSYKNEFGDERKWGHPKTIMILRNEKKIRPFLVIALGNLNEFEKYGYYLTNPNIFKDDESYYIFKQILDNVKEIIEGLNRGRNDSEKIYWKTYRDDYYISPKINSVLSNEEIIGIPLKDFLRKIKEENLRIVKHINSQAKSENNRNNTINNTINNRIPKI